MPIKQHIDQCRFKAAQAIAKAAEWLDYQKNTPYIGKTLRAALAYLVERLHDLAQLLAASRAGEIYSTETEFNLLQEATCFSTITTH